MKKNKLLVVLIGSLVILSCSGGPNDSDDGSCTNCQVNGMPAKDYYQQFSYSVQGNCQDKSTIHFRLFGTQESADVGLDSQGRKIRAEVTLSLRPNGTYLGRYQEYVSIPIDSELSEMHTLVDKDLSGSWSVVGTRLHISGLGVGTGLLINKRNAVTLKVQGFRLDTNLEGKLLLMGQVFSTVGEGGETINQYCSRR